MDDSIEQAIEHFEKAYAYKANNEIENALYECERAAQLAPHWPDPPYVRAHLLELLGRNQEAQAALKHADSLASSNQRNGRHGANAANVASAPRVPWTSRDVWLGFALFIGSVIAFVVVYGALYALSIEINLDLLIVINEVLFLVPIWWFVWRKYGSDWKTLGFRGFSWSALGIGVALLFGAYILMGIYGTIVTELFDSEMQPDLAPIADEMSFPWLLIITTVVVAPLVEEMFFRGFIFAGFWQRYGWQKAALISSALFALVHLQPLAFIPIFILGYVFAYIYYRSKSIWPGILMHFTVNLLAVVVEFAIESD
ncbi:type II CAAX prenyl endopeptidase Rce1 family protein [Chloroflexota bacterium]